MTAEHEPAKPGSYPVTFDVEPRTADRNRLTVAFRVVLAIPHILLIGGPGLGFAGAASVAWVNSDRPMRLSSFSSSGALGTVAFVMAFIAWFAILFAGTHPRGLWDFARLYMRWRTKAIAYMALLRDEYPPFGDGDYPVSYDVIYPEGRRNKWSVGLRVIYVIPHLVVLLFLGFAWTITAIVAWVVILFTGTYPEGLYRFAVGYLRWSVRVESYMLLMRDEYPPFSLDP